MKDEIYTLGVIGGMGPLATVRFEELLIRNTPAGRDQDHLPMMIEHRPYIPDRTAYILDPTRESPVPWLKDAALKLQGANVAEIAVPCVTSHFFHDEVSSVLSVPLLDGVEDTAERIVKDGFHRVGIMATDGTVKSGLFTKALQPYGVECVCPDEPYQKKVMDLIYQCVKSNRDVDKEDVNAVICHLHDKGAEVCILGCTELSLLPKEYLTGKTLDVLEILAQRCLTDWENHEKSRT